MHHYWKDIIEPALLAGQVKSIVEVGAWRGDNTINLLRFCKANQATLEIIDPLPEFEKKDEIISNKGFYRLHKELSLHTLPKLQPYDAILLDGDHNWYTLYSELKLIDQKHSNDPEKYPILFFHDICWPYARRDLYYNPETIPPEFMHEHKQAGIKQGQTALDDKFYFNSQLHNAVMEGGEKNGVLTAIEDYLKTSAIEFEFTQIPFFHGLGILISKARLQKQKELRDFVQKLVSSKNLIHMMKEFEKHRAEDFTQTYHNNKNLSMEKDILTQKNSELSQKLDSLQNNTWIKFFTKIQNRLQG